MQSNHRRLFCFVLLLSFTSFGLTACGAPSQAAHITTIGIISNSANLDPVLAGFKVAMAQAGFVEGKSVIYVYDGVVASDNATIDQEIQKVANQNPDVYLSVGSTPALRMKDLLQTTNKSLVFAAVANPEKLGLVQDLLKPGGRMTGVNTGGPITSKGIEWLLTVDPNLKRVHVFYLHGEVQAPPQFPALQAVADKLSVQLLFHEVNSPADIMPIVSSLSGATDGIYVPVTALAFTPHGLDFIPLAAKQGIPIGSSISQTQGLLASIGLNFAEAGRQDALLIQQILHGADAGTLPVEPAQYGLQVNVATAEMLGLSIPDTVLKRADTIIRVNQAPPAIASPTAVPRTSTPPAI